MTQPYEFTPVTEADTTKRDPSELLALGRCRGKLLIIRPQEYVAEGFKTSNKPEGTDVIRADIALLDQINPAEDAHTGDQLPGYAAGTQFRDQLVFAGYLKGTFKRYIGKTLIGTIYTTPTEYSRPALRFQDLSGDPQAVARAQSFLTARPEFLIPTNAAITSTTPQPTPSAVPAQGNGQVYQQDPWSIPATTAGVAPASAPPVPQSVPPQMNTLEQMKQWQAQQPHSANQDPPF